MTICLGQVSYCTVLSNHSMARKAPSKVEARVQLPWRSLSVITLLRLLQGAL